jgi:hypothetical protein
MTKYTPIGWPQGTHFRYQPSIKKIQKLISYFGTSAILRRKGAVTGPANRPVVGEPEFFQIIVVDTNRKLLDVEGTLVENFTRTLYMAPTDLVTPGKGDRLLLVPHVANWIQHKDLGDEHFVNYFEALEVRTIAPGGVALLHEIDISR